MIKSRRGKHTAGGSGRRKALGFFTVYSVVELQLVFPVRSHLFRANVSYLRDCWQGSLGVLLWSDSVNRSRGSCPAVLSNCTNTLAARDRSVLPDSNRHLPGETRHRMVRWRDQSACGWAHPLGGGNWGSVLKLDIGCTPRKAFGCDRVWSVSQKGKRRRVGVAHQTNGEFMLKGIKPVSNYRAEVIAAWGHEISGIIPRKPATPYRIDAEDVIPEAESNPNPG